VKQEVTKVANEPIELYEFMLGSYRETPKERLLEFLAGYPDIERLRGLPRDELAKFYCEAVTASVVAQGGAAKRGESRGERGGGHQ
jgi:hypothetical protein